MKVLKLILLLLILNGTLCQDANTRFANFVKLKLIGYPAWLQENNLIPDKLEYDGRFFFNSSLSFGIDSNGMKGSFWNREYHGAENNISASSINANLDQLSFSIDLGYGDESSHYVTGEYVITGRTGAGSGNFTRSGQTNGPLNFEMTCYMEVTPEGYFNLYGYLVTHYIPDFANLTLEGFEGFYKSEELVHSAYSLQFDDSPNTPQNWRFYMTEVFLKTPIEDIIGETLPPTIAQKPRKHLKNVNEVVFDEKRHKFMRKISSIDI